MVIQFYGAYFVRVSLGDTVFAFNPVGKKAPMKAPRFGADAVFVSMNDDYMNGVENMSFGDKKPFVVDGPGEYEIGGTFVEGFLSTGPDGKVNTIYTATIDGIKICVLGALASENISPDIKEKIGSADIVFAPVGAGGTVLPKDSAKLIANMDPKMIIPIGFEDEKDKNLEAFLKENGGAEKPVDKLSIKRKDIESMEAEPVVVKSF